jgi:hypothetical protein
MIIIDGWMNDAAADDNDDDDVNSNSVCFNIYIL